MQLKLTERIAKAKLIMQLKNHIARLKLTERVAKAYDYYQLNVIKELCS